MTVATRPARARLARRLPAGRRRAARGARASTRRAPSACVETGDRGGGRRPHARHRPEAEDVVFAELERLHDAGRALHRRLRGARRRRLRRRRASLVVVDPIDGSLNAKRGLPHHALSIAVADGPTMADVVFGYVYDLGPGEEWRAVRGDGAFLDGVPLEPAARAARRATAGSRSSPSSRPTRAGSRGLRRARATSPAACARSGSIAVSLCQVAAGARRRDGDAAGSCRAVDAAAAQLIVRESGGLVAFTALDDAARRARWTSSRTPPSSPRARAEARSTSCAAPAGADDRLGPRRARRRGPSPATGAAGTEPAGRPRGPAADGASEASPPTRRCGRARRCRAPEAVDRAAWARREPRDDARDARPAADEAADTAVGAVARRCAAPAGLPARRRGRRARRLHGPARARASTSSSLLDPERPAAAAARRAEPRATRPRELDADLDELLAWVALHEVTHAVQFRSVPWLRAHLGGAAARAARVGRRQARPRRARCGCRRATTSRALVDRLRDGGLVGAVAGPERKALLDRVQAAMALVEGHAEHVMDAAGAPRARRPARAARGAGPPPRRAPAAGALLERLLGLELKLRQYEVGKRFCDAVVEQGGMAGAEPRLDGARAPADAGRARGPGRLAAPHRGAAARRPPASPGGRRGVTAVARAGLQTCVRWRTLTS